MVFTIPGLHALQRRKHCLQWVKIQRDYEGKREGRSARGRAVGTLLLLLLLLLLLMLSFWLLSSLLLLPALMTLRCATFQVSEMVFTSNYRCGRDPHPPSSKKKDSSHEIRYAKMYSFSHNHGSGNGAVFQKATTSRVIFCHCHDYGRVISIILTQSPMAVILVLKFLDAAPKWGSSSKIAAGNSPAKTKDMTLEQETKYSSTTKHTQPYLYSHIMCIYININMYIYIRTYII